MNAAGSGPLVFSRAASHARMARRREDERVLLRAVGGDHRRHQDHRGDLDRRGDRPPEFSIVEAQARTLFRDWRGLLAGDPTEARPGLRQLLEGRRIRFTPLEKGPERGYGSRAMQESAACWRGSPRVAAIGVPKHSQLEPNR